MIFYSIAEIKNQLYLPIYPSILWGWICYDGFLPYGLYKYKSFLSIYIEYSHWPRK